MAIAVNGITIPENADSVYANGINLDTIVANNIIVWQKQKDLDIFAARPDGWNFYITGNGYCSFKDNYIESYNYGSGNHDNYYYGFIDLTRYNKIRVSGWATGDTATSGSSKGLISIRILQNNSVVLRSTGIGTESGANWRENQPEEDWDVKLVETKSPYSTNGQDATIHENNYEGRNVAVSFDMIVDISKISGNSQVQLHFSHWGGSNNPSSTLRVYAFQFLSN